MCRETSSGRKLLLNGIGPRPLRVEPWGRGAHRRRIIQFHELGRLLLPWLFLNVGNRHGSTNDRIVPTIR